MLHRAATLSLSTIGLTIRREGHEALVTKDFISTNLSAEFYIRVEPNEDDVNKAARTIGIDEGHASTDAIRDKAQAAARAEAGRRASARWRRRTTSWRCT